MQYKQQQQEEQQINKGYFLACNLQAKQGALSLAFTNQQMRKKKWCTYRKNSFKSLTEYNKW